MRTGKLLWIVVLFGWYACSGPKITTSSKQNAESAFARGDYNTAVHAWTQYFEQIPLEQVAGEDFALAAKAAFQNNDTGLAINWYDRARYKNFSSAEMYSILAEIYRAQDNLSKELSSLEFYAANFSTGKNEVTQRLFELYREAGLTDKALESWSDLDEKAKNSLPNLTSFFQLNRERENTVICDSVSLLVLEKDPKNVEALEWNAKKYYWAGENRYQEEMKKYNQNKTTRQYRILLSELDKVTADFKKALPYFEKLWTVEKGEKYAGYLATIYARFGDEMKSEYYKKFLKN